MSVFRLQERIEGHPPNEVIRRASIYGLEKDSRLTGTSPVHLHCSWSLVLISDSFCVQRRDKAIENGAWSLVCLIICRLCTHRRELTAIHSR
jgi:hypothetical protein